MKNGFSLIVFNLLLIVFNVFIFIIPAILGYKFDFEDQKTISKNEWEYISKLDSYSEFFLYLSLACFFIFLFLSIIQILIAAKRLLQNKEKVNPWKNFYRISITILLILFTPYIVIASFTIGVFEQKDRFAKNLELEIREYLVDSKSYVFEPDWSKNEYFGTRKKFKLVDMFNLDKETYELESYIKKFPPEKNYFRRRDTPNYEPWYGRKVVSIKSLYAKNEKNYFCSLESISSNRSKWKNYKGELYAIYTLDKNKLQNADILIPDKNKLLFDREFDGVRSNSKKEITFENEKLNISQSKEIVGVINNDVSTEWVWRSVDMICEKISSETMLENKVQLHIPME